MTNYQLHTFIYVLLLLLVIITSNRWILQINVKLITDYLLKKYGDRLVLQSVVYIIHKSI